MNDIVLVLLLIQRLLFLLLHPAFVVELRFCGLLGALSTEADFLDIPVQMSLLLLGMSTLSVPFCPIPKAVSSCFEMNIFGSRIDRQRFVYILQT